MERIWLKIGEVAAQIDVKPKELRYWERVIPELRVRRSKGNLRYYHIDDLQRLVKVRNWLQKGYTVADCRELLLTGHLANTLCDHDGDCRVSSTILSCTNAAVPRDDQPAPNLSDVTTSLKRLLTQLSLPINH